MTWPSISTITLFTEDLAAAKAFYEAVFGQPVVFEDDDSAVFRFGGQQVNLLSASAVPELIEPAVMGSGPRVLLTITVDDVDQTCEDLTRRGARLINGPVDRPWGVRTACFADPSGHLWEIAH
jgi:catechol 2,3-dioxygenase-like lactoylglutathione lyase family enzyme